MINKLNQLRDDTIVGCGFINYVRIYNTENVKNLIYVINDKSIIGSTGIFCYKKDDKTSYFITDEKDKYIDEYAVLSAVRESNSSYYVSEYNSKQLKIIYLNEIIKRLDTYINIDVSLTMNSISIYHNIGPMINIGKKITYSRLIDNFQLVITALDDIKKSYNKYMEELQYNLNINSDDPIKLMSYKTIEELCELKSIVIDENNRYMVDDLTKTLQSFKTSFDNMKISYKNMFNKKICNVGFKYDDYKFKMKYSNILNCNVSSYNSSEILFKILMKNNNYDKFISEVKSNIIKTM